MVKNEWHLSDYETLKSGVFPKESDELSRLIEWYLHADRDGLMFGLITNILCVFDI